MVTSAFVRLSGFEHINTYYDDVQGIETAKLLPGEYYVTTQKEAIVTVLGSCVSACIRDRVYGVGGMNHFMLPVCPGEHRDRKLSSENKVALFGCAAMKLLIHDILAKGGTRKNLEVKVFGGGRVVEGLPDIGNCNTLFVLKYLKEEGLPVISQDLNGNYARKIYYFPQTGRVLMKKLFSLHNDTVVHREKVYFQKIKYMPTGDKVVLL